MYGIVQKYSSRPKPERSGITVTDTDSVPSMSETLLNPLSPNAETIAVEPEKPQPEKQVSPPATQMLTTPVITGISQELVSPTNTSDVATVSITVSVDDVHGADVYDVFVVTA